MMKQATVLTSFLVLLVIFATPAWAQTGRIAGQVTDASTGEPLPGVNVVVVGTQQGATTDVEGQYSILNVSPGTYDLRATFVGYTPVTQEGVRVNIDLTTEVDFQLQEQTEQLDEITVQATEPVVKRDVSASVANLSSEDIENLPVADVEEVIGLQAGFERGLTIRGSGGSQVAFQVDGISMASGRNNAPFTGISYTAVDEVQVQTGGFNAEYGNVRSGLINVVTKNPPRDRYTADLLTRYSPASQKSFGMTPGDPMAYWVRPRVDDPDVPNDRDPAFVGTSVWDQYTQNQYYEFPGWNSLAEDFSLNTDNDPSNNVTPEQMEQAFREWYLRKDFEITNPDYTIDGTIGGPVPGVSSYLGDLRFTASYRQSQSAYLVPFPDTRETYDERTFQGKVLSDVASNMRLQLQGMYATQLGMNPSEQGWPDMITGDMPAYPWDGRGSLLANVAGGGDGGGPLFSGWRYNPMDIDRLMLAGEFTHTLSSNTFYEARLERMATDYWTRPPRERSDEVAYTLGPIELNETPFGFTWENNQDIFGTGMRTSGHWGSGRDTSNVTRWRSQIDITSQLNQFMQVKSGLEYIIANYDSRFGEVDPAHPHHSNPDYIWNRTPRQGAGYAQSKLEFEGMVANLGVRLDYFYPGGEWYEFDPFSRVLSAQWGADSLEAPTAMELETWGTTPTERQFALSPRLGISFPVTEVSKLYFNYGHFRQMLDPTSMFVVEEINTGAVNWIGNPNHPLPRTVAYELGYEQSFLDQFLVRVAGYYRDLANQPRAVWYQSVDDAVNYRMDRPWNYGDVRGVEITLNKNQGDWVRGFVNYTYMASKSGNFGFSNIYENPVEMRSYVRTSTDYYQSKPTPEPYARFNIGFLVPDDFGPELAGLTPLADWRINFLGQWRQGQPLTWTGFNLVGGRSPVRELQNNVNWRDYYNLDMRLAKNFNTGVGDVQFYVDLTNVLNLRHMHRYSIYEGNEDQQRYLESLHLPEDTFEGLEGGDPYQFIPGDDQPGDFRDPDAPFVPIEFASRSGDGQVQVNNPMTRPLYYVTDNGSESGTYMWYRNGQFEEADEAYVNSVIENKQYIDMPNELYHAFLNPRNVFFGLRLSF